MEKLVLLSSSARQTSCLQVQDRQVIMSHGNMMLKEIHSDSWTWCKNCGYLSSWEDNVARRYQGSLKGLDWASQWKHPHAWPRQLGGCLGKKAPQCFKHAFLGLHICTEACIDHDILYMHFFLGWILSSNPYFKISIGPKVTRLLNNYRTHWQDQGSHSCGTALSWFSCKWDVLLPHSFLTIGMGDALECTSQDVEMMARRSHPDRHSGCLTILVVLSLPSSLLMLSA